MVPRTHQGFVDAWSSAPRRAELLERYASQQQSFVPQLLPRLALELPARQVLELLSRRLGAETLGLALDPRHTDPAGGRDLPAALASPVARCPDGAWLREVNMVGVNVRTVGSFWGVVKYCLTLPQIQSSVHLLPIWEAGVVDSLYGMSSWQLNPEFFSHELQQAAPRLDTVERQLKALVNLLHASGRTVGMDVIPHTDRYSEIVLLNPQLFEWLQRDGLSIVDHRERLHLDVQRCIEDFLREYGPATAGDAAANAATLFSSNLAEGQRRDLLFGEAADHAGREVRRIELVKHLRARGYEPVPATMAPPYRGLEVDPREQAIKRDEHGMVWRDFRITEPQPMSRVFGPLARYKLYGRRDDNANWEIDFDRPRTDAWSYVCQRYAEVQQRYGFDFMRGDMSHVQMRPGGVPPQIYEHYDLLRAVKRHVRDVCGVRYFGYFAESFLAPPGVMAYGDEVAHLEASEADVTLGDLQSTAVGSTEFVQRARRYLDLARCRRCVPCFSVITADKDDPRFDQFYLDGNEARLFIGLFLEQLPSYASLGFEVRDRHSEPAPNEHYTKLYVFHETEGPKATRGPYVWGENGGLFSAVTRLRLLADDLWPAVRGHGTRWLLPPDPTLGDTVWAWTQRRQPGHLFVVNVDPLRAVQRWTLPGLHQRDPAPALRLLFSTDDEVTATDQLLQHNGLHYPALGLGPGEARVYEVQLACISHQPPTAARDSFAASRPSPSSLLQRTASTPQSASGPRSPKLLRSHTPRDGVGEQCRPAP